MIGTLLPAAALAVGLVLAHQPLAAAPLPATGPTGGSYPGFEVRYGMASLLTPQDVLALIDRPATLDSYSGSFLDPATRKKIVEGRGEAHAVYALPIEVLASVLDTTMDQLRFSPGLLDERINLKDGPRTVVYQELGIEFLGIRVSYKTRSEIYRDELPGGAIGFRARLVESLDGKIYESFSSWYLCPVTAWGKTYTYVRFYMHTGLRQAMLGMETAMKSFIPQQSTDMITANANEAKRRLQQQQAKGK
jgi:hypothetical protein